MQFGKMIGSVFLLMGTLIGGGILAIPLVSAGVSFFAASCLLIFMWLLMLITGFLFLEVNLAFPFSKTNFSSMAFLTLGNPGKVATVLSYLILLYALVAAYVSAGGSLLNELFQQMQIHLSSESCSLLFVALFGLVVFHGIQAVDYLNCFFFSLKGLLLILFIGLSLQKVDVHLLTFSNHSSKYLWAAAPIFLCAFGYHILIPVLGQYLHYEKKQLKFVLFWGSFLTLVLYLFWLAVTMGVVPLDGFLQLALQKGSVGEFVLMFSSFFEKQVD